LFRISHRYFPPANSGYETYFGINGPATILLSLGYGITDALSISVGHTNLLHQWELNLKWVALQPGALKGLPLGVALNGGMGWVTQEQLDRSLIESDNFKYVAQLSLAYQLSDRFAFLVVPGYTTNTAYWEGSSEGTLTTGTGGRFSFYKNYSIIGEWVAVLSGHKKHYNGWGLGLESKIGGHVFQVMVSNTYGMTTDHYLSGGDLDFRNNEYRFGFNIFRTFWF